MALSDIGPTLAKCGPPYWSRDRSRSARKRIVRARTINLHRVTRKQADVLFEPSAEPVEVVRPITRADCANVPRPCPFVSCKYNLYLDVHEKTGNLKLNFPDIEPDEMGASCVLDITDLGMATLERTGEVMNVVRERVRQIEDDAVRKITRRLPMFPTFRELGED